MCLVLCVYTAIVLGINYLFLGAFYVVFEGAYDFNQWQVALSFLGMLIGMIGAVASGEGLVLRSS